MTELMGILVDSSKFNLELSIIDVNEDGSAQAEIAMNDYTREFFEQLAEKRNINFNDVMIEFLLNYANNEDNK